MTFFFEDNVHILSCVCRMGVGEANVDNASRGGIFCSVKDNGQLGNEAFDILLNKYPTHPTTHINFETINIPIFDKCKQLCKDLACIFVQYTRLISWDFAIDEQGVPIFIEANLSFGQIDFHQITNGPIFKDMTLKVLEFVKKNNPLLN